MFLDKHTREAIPVILNLKQRHEFGRNTLRPLENRYNESGGLAGVEVDVVMQESNGWDM